MIAEAAYFRAERRGFADGDAVRDWCEAEAEVDALLRRQREDEELGAKIEDMLATASKKLGALRRKASRLSTEARGEWQRDVEKLAALRESLRPKLAELREQGERAGLKLREQAEKIHADVAELVRKLEAKAKH